MREKSNYIIIYYVTVTTNISQQTLQIDEPELSYIQLSYIVVQPQILKETTIKQYYTPKCLISCSLSNCFFCRVSLLIFYKAGKAKRKEKRSACRRPIKHTGFFTVQNNQLYNIAGYLQFTWALFAFYLYSTLCSLKCLNKGPFGS